MQTPSTDSDEGNFEIKPKIDPRRKMLTDFLKNHRSYEETLKDVI